jgi:hypothetical protein
MELGKRGKGRENDRVSVIPHIKDVKVEDVRMCVESC